MTSTINSVTSSFRKLQKTVCFYFKWSSDTSLIPQRQLTVFIFTFLAPRGGQHSKSPSSIPGADWLIHSFQNNVLSCGEINPGQVFCSVSPNNLNHDRHLKWNKLFFLFVASTIFLHQILYFLCWFILDKAGTVF